MADPRRTELGAFLRSRRERLDRAALGLPPGSRGRTTGLRREEVSVESGVSMTWYTWLEQGRDIHPSRQVLLAVADALRLTDAERRYALGLAGYAPPRPARVDEAPAHLQRLMDALPHPAYALAPDWGMAGWNTAYERLYPRIAAVARGERNLLWLVFTDPYVRTLLDDWDVTSRRFLAEFRAEVGRATEPQAAQLVRALIEASPEFRAGWESYDIGGFESRERVFHLPDGTVETFEHHQLRPSDRPDLQVVLYTPLPGR
ncbi:XRE family transcriptional regulator [Microbacterium protaetiae]|uniref:XRE family transcriptional regulator n=1 Tax=Microbacterium protaetiae TaxID=2509458 RepID=A0A4P6ECU1_9MICO|nr:helix-turn-helix transcriptional regulator [Microbacterium protaetiae]QAY59466.1 XRE family transcriptional regulator [Microbacterium protaetiae]